MTREDPQIKLRIPEALRDRIKEEAEVNKRSMNAEILAALAKQYPPKSIDVNVLADFFESLIAPEPGKLDEHREYISMINDMLARSKRQWTLEPGWDGVIKVLPYGTPKKETE